MTTQIHELKSMPIQAYEDYITSLASSSRIALITNYTTFKITDIGSALLLDHKMCRETFMNYFKKSMNKDGNGVSFVRFIDPIHMSTLQIFDSLNPDGFPSIIDTVVIGDMWDIKQSFDFNAGLEYEQGVKTTNEQKYSLATAVVWSKSRAIMLKFINIILMLKKKYNALLFSLHLEITNKRLIQDKFICRNVNEVIELSVR